MATNKILKMKTSVDSVFLIKFFILSDACKKYTFVTCQNKT